MVVVVLGLAVKPLRPVVGWIRAVVTRACAVQLHLGSRRRTANTIVSHRRTGNTTMITCYQDNALLAGRSSHNPSIRLLPPSSLIPLPVCLYSFVSY